MRTIIIVKYAPMAVSSPCGRQDRPARRAHRAAAAAHAPARHRRGSSCRRARSSERAGAAPADPLEAPADRPRHRLPRARGTGRRWPGDAARAARPRVRLRRVRSGASPPSRLRPVPARRGRRRGGDAADAAFGALASRLPGRPRPAGSLRPLLALSAEGRGASPRGQVPGNGYRERSKATAATVVTGTAMTSPAVAASTPRTEIAIVSPFSATASGLLPSESSRTSGSAPPK